ncbi:unnamed protein product [Scomber scombrus]|uniref:Unnamed protein product n=1 Tax=Scomber scombrus TaxID=13677 RepID=A0AAV1NIU5_SCOSC
MLSGVASVEDILGSLYAKPTARFFATVPTSPHPHPPPQTPSLSLFLSLPPIHNILMRNGAGDNNAVTCRKARLHRGDGRQLDVRCHRLGNLRRNGTTGGRLVLSRRGGELCKPDWVEQHIAQPHLSRRRPCVPFA